MANSGAQVVRAVKALVAEDETLEALLKLVGSRTNNRGTITAQQAAFLTRTSYSEMVSSMKGLGETGAGRFIRGRRGKKTRIEWSYKPLSLAAALKGDGELEPLNDDDGEWIDDDDVGSNASGPTAESTSDDMVYEFYVRPDHPVVFTLPQDFTEREAERLKSRLRSIPFSDQDGGQTSTDEVSYQFVVRPTRVLTFALPQDLSESEAKRLRYFVSSLPFGKDC